MIPLHEQVTTVETRLDLARFVRSLKADLQRDPDGWENADLGRYLVALSAWVEDMEGYYLNQGESVPQEPDWKMLGQMLLAASMYE